MRKSCLKVQNVVNRAVAADDASWSNAIYEECVCRGMPSIEIKTGSGLISHHNLGHYLI